jgi:hypothetical protein
MLLTKKLNTTIVPLNYNRLKELYKDIKMYDVIEIKIEHLSEKSPIIIDCSCEICGICNRLQYRSYLRNKNRYNYYSCKKCKNKKTALTKEKLYGDSNYNNSIKMIETKEKSGIYIPLDSVDDFKKYRKLVNRFTLKFKKSLFINWDGIDFYDKNDISKNVKLSSNNMDYPTIDHRISLYQGFKESIPPYIIGGINNLCITKRRINLLKSNKYDFKY